jgi:hypothetical protein
MNDEDIDAGQLRREVRGKYRDVALQPGRALPPLSVLIAAIRLYQSQWACWRVALMR